MVRPVLLVATLGRTPHLGEALATFQRAAGEDARVVLVAPRAVASGLASCWPGAQVVAETSSSGLYGGLNVGRTALAERTDWDWVTVLSDDDFFLPGFGETLARAAELDPRERHLVAGHVVYANETGERLFRIPRAGQPEAVRALLAAGVSPMNPQGLLWSRAAWEAAGPYRADWKICADTAHLWSGLQAGGCLHYHGQEAAAFRLRREQISSDVARHQAEFSALQAEARGHVVPGRNVRWRFRWDNRGAYWERWRKVGWRRGLELFREAETRRP